MFKGYKELQKDASTRLHSEAKFAALTETNVYFSCNDGIEFLIYRLGDLKCVGSDYAAEESFINDVENNRITQCTHTSFYNINLVRVEQFGMDALTCDDVVLLSEYQYRLSSLNDDLTGEIKDLLLGGVTFIKDNPEFLDKVLDENMDELQNFAFDEIMEVVWVDYDIYYLINGMTVPNGATDLYVIREHDYEFTTINIDELNMQQKINLLNIIAKYK